MRQRRRASSSRTASARRKSARCWRGRGAGWAGCDNNNDGKPDLYVTSGRPMDDSMHPYPLKQKPEVLPHNHLFRNDGGGKFTDVTEQAGGAANIYGMAADAAGADQHGREKLVSPRD